MRRGPQTAAEAARHCLDIWASAVGNKGQNSGYARMLAMAYGRGAGAEAATIEESLCERLVEDTPGFTALRPFLERTWVQGHEATPCWQSEYRARVAGVYAAVRSSRHAGFCGHLDADMRLFEANLGEAYLEQAALSSIEDL